MVALCWTVQKSFFSSDFLFCVEKMFKTRRVQVIKCEFCAEGSSEGSLISEMS